MITMAVTRFSPVAWPRSVDWWEPDPPGRRGGGGSMGQKCRYWPGVFGVAGADHGSCQDHCLRAALGAGGLGGDDCGDGVWEWRDFSDRVGWFPREIGLASGLVGAAGGIGGFLVPIGFGLLREVRGRLCSVLCAWPRPA